MYKEAYIEIAHGRILSSSHASVDTAPGNVRAKHLPKDPLQLLTVIPFSFEEGEHRLPDEEMIDAEVKDMGAAGGQSAHDACALKPCQRLVGGHGSQSRQPRDLTAGRPGRRGGERSKRRDVSPRGKQRIQRSAHVAQHVCRIPYHWLKNKTYDL